MRRAAMYGMVGALTLTFGTIVIPSENFVRQNNRDVQESVIPTVSKETETEKKNDAPKLEKSEEAENASNTAQAPETGGTAGTVDAAAVNSVQACEIGRASCRERV